MAEIRKSPLTNKIGGGYRNELRLDYGDVYEIRNSPLTNNIGGGYRQEIRLISKGTPYPSDDKIVYVGSTPEQRAYFASTKHGIKIAFYIIGIILAIVAFGALWLGMIPLLSWLARTIM